MCSVRGGNQGCLCGEQHGVWEEEIELDGVLMRKSAGLHGVLMADGGFMLGWCRFLEEPRRLCAAN